MRTARKPISFPGPAHDGCCQVYSVPIRACPAAGVQTERLFMTDQKSEEHTPLEEPLAELERQLISAYVAGAGEDLQLLRGRTDARARQVLVEASRYASEKLSEIEARLHYLRNLHGQA